MCYGGVNEEVSRRRVEAVKSLRVSVNRHSLLSLLPLLSGHYSCLRGGILVAN